MRLTRWIIVWSVSISLLSGCISAVDYTGKLDASENCCTRLSEITYQPLTFGDPTEVLLGEEGHEDCFNFPEGRGFLAAFELPINQIPYSINVRSLATQGQVVLPVATILDTNYRITRTIPKSDFEYSNGNFITTIFVNDENESDRYLIVHSVKESEQVGKRITSDQRGVPVGSGMLYLYLTSITDVATSPGGQIIIELKHYHPLSTKEYHQQQEQY